MPHDLPPWHTVYQQSQRWLKAKVFEAIVHDLRGVLWVAQGRNALPSAAICDSRTLQSSLKVAHERATMGPNAAGARRCTWPWIP
jgi:transposase